PAAARWRPRRRQRPHEVEAGSEPVSVPISRLTVIPAEPFGDADAAERWRREIGGDRAALEDAVGDALATVNRALHAHAVATQEPAASQVARGQVLAARVGFGSGEELADGRWSQAVEVPAPRE